MSFSKLSIDEVNVYYYNSVLGMDAAYISVQLAIPYDEVCSMIESAKEKIASIDEEISHPTIKNMISFSNDVDEYLKNDKTVSYVNDLTLEYINSTSLSKGAQSYLISTVLFYNTLKSIIIERRLEDNSSNHPSLMFFGTYTNYKGSYKFSILSVADPANPITDLRWLDKIPNTIEDKMVMQEIFTLYILKYCVYYNITRKNHKWEE